jgi:integrase
MHLEWTDISFERRTLQVRSKPRFKHKIKDSEEREITLTAELVKELREYREKHPDDRVGVREARRPSRCTGWSPSSALEDPGEEGGANLRHL